MEALCSDCGQLHDTVPPSLVSVWQDILTKWCSTSNVSPVDYRTLRGSLSFKQKIVHTFVASNGQRSVSCDNQIRFVRKPSQEYATMEQDIVVDRG